LLKANPDIYAVDNFNRTPFHYAAMNTASGVCFSLLLAYKDQMEVAKVTKKIQGMEAKDESSTDSNLENSHDEESFDINLKDTDGMSILHYLVRYSYHLITDLINRGAHVDILNHNNYSPLLVAAQCANKYSCEELFKTRFAVA